MPGACRDDNNYTTAFLTMPLFRPCIYQLDAYERIAAPDAASLPAKLESEIRSVAALGFDHVLCDADTAVAGSVLAAAKAAGMAALLQLSSLSLHEEPASAVSASDEPPDPRFARSTRPAASADLHDAQARQQAEQDCAARLAETVRTDGWAGIC